MPLTRNYEDMGFYTKGEKVAYSSSTQGSSWGRTQCLLLRPGLYASELPQLQALNRCQHPSENSLRWVCNCTVSLVMSVYRGKCVHFYL